MRAAVYRRYGGPTAVEEIAAPYPKAGEILVKVAAAGLNSWDWDKASGNVFGRIEGPFAPRHPVLGGEIAGTVVALGEGVTGFRPGDAVLGDLTTRSWGGFAELAVGRADRFIGKPEGLDFASAACIPQAGLLALQGLEGIGPGSRVLVNGGGGGMGSIAIHLATRQGADVTGVDCAEKAEAMRNWGAAHSIDYRETDFADLPDRYDLVLDAVASRPIGRHFDVLAPGGRYVVVGGRVPALLQTVLLGKSHIKRDGRQVKLLIWEPRTEDMARLAALLAEGAIKVPIEGVHGLEGVSAALAAIGEGRVIGKRVIAPAGP